MSRKFISGILVISLLAGIFLALNPFTVEKVSAEENRGGYVLAPETSDSTGVSTVSRFIFESQKQMTLEELREDLSIIGEPAPDISVKDLKTFYITPSKELEKNKLYTFKLKQSSGDDITWTFQTSSIFKILGAFPADKSSGVPTNSGIEIYFSHENFEDINDYFKISPSAKVIFERHKSTAVFIPEGELKEGTLYTVTIKGGIKLSGTKYSTNEDYSFKFETASDKSSDDNFEMGQFNYIKILNEYTPHEKPAIPVNYYINTNAYKSSSIKVSTTVYGYASLDSFIAALDKKDSVPSWAYLNYQRNDIPTSKLNKVTGFDQEFPVNSNTQQFVKIPQTLPAGYYLIDSKWDDDRFQTFIQVTDIGMYIAKSETKTIIWLNDLSDKKPIENATINLIGDKNSFKSDSKGIAYFNTPADSSDSSDSSSYDYNYFKVTTGDKKTSLLYYNSYNYNYYGSSSNIYWNYIYLDRNLYKPDDTIQFWGFIKNRYADENISSLTLEFGQGHRYYTSGKANFGKSLGIFPIDNQPMVKQEINVQNGAFKGSFELPSPDPGGYLLQVKNGDEIVASTYVQVQNYIKPPYKLEITKDKEAVFPGSAVNFSFKASFYEGTGLPDLGLNISGVVSENKKSDANGEVKVKYTPYPSKDKQGEIFADISCNASLPEIGEMSQSSGVRVFVNDINVALTSNAKKDMKTITAKVNEIVLDRLNDGSAKDSGDYLGNAVDGKLLKGKILKNTWVKIPDGRYYDFINKVVKKRYRYELKTEQVKSFTMTTDRNGEAAYDFNGKDFSGGYYTADITCTDGTEREMNFKVYLTAYYDTSSYYSYDDNRYFLDGGKESYRLDDKVNLTFKKGKTVLPGGKYLFFKAQNGISEYNTQNSPNYSFTLREKDIPNTFVSGVFFNGITYVESETFNTVFDYKEKNLVLSAETDKASYKPGDTAIIKITAKDKSGAVKKAFVNTSIVDEALFSLSGQKADTLAELYSGVPSGISFTYESHLNSESINGNYNYGIPKMYFRNEMVSTDAIKQKGASSSSSAVREDFRDTAHFETVTLDDNGYGEIKFKLPDNITSWRVTLTGITSDLLGGSNTCTLKVSLPFFINYSLNSTYLTGDKPVLGVNAYGNDLKSGDTVNFEVSSTANPNKVVKAKGKAFERVNIPLWELSEGKDELVIKASTGDGLSDSMQQKISVVNSYHQIDKVLYYNLTPGLKFDGGTSGNTSLVFSDKSRGAFLPEIAGLMYSSGNRIEQQLSASIALELLQKYFKYDDVTADESFKVTDYQTQDGGIALLPYGGSNADVSAKLVTLIKDKVNTQKLKEYFYSILYSDSPGLKGNALYGLAVLREPILLELDKASSVEDASIKDMLYIALAYCELGENQKAQKLYNGVIMNSMQEFKPLYRVDSGSDKDDILECTSLASILASKLDMPQKQGLYDYCTSNATTDILINIEKLLYISQEIGKYNDETVKFTYSLDGEKYTETLTGGQSFTLTLPSRNLDHLKIESVEGSISMVSIFKDNIAGIDKVDSDISVSRNYYIGNTRDNSKTSFKQGDIVLVEIKCHMSKKALDGGYEVTDYLPSGLKPIENQNSFGLSYQEDGIYTRVEGQKVTFYAYKDKDGNQTYSYYARVISPGTFKADGTIIQGIQSRDSINVGDVETVTIK